MTMRRPSLLDAFWRGWGALTVPFRTLRFRLMLWNAATLLLTATVALYTLRTGVRRLLLQQIDQRLEQDLRDIAMSVPDDGSALIEENPNHPLKLEINRRAAGRVVDQWYCRLMDGERLIWKSLNTPATASNLSDSTGRNYEVQTIGNFRVMQFPKKFIVPPLIIQVGVSLEKHKDELAELNLFLLLSLGGFIIVSPWIGYWLAGRTTKSVRVSIQTARRLHPEHLQERLPTRGSGDELDQLANTVNDLLDRIAAHLQVRRDFLANAAHELRTPLAAIRSSVEVALSGKRSAEEYQDLLAAVIEEAGELENLVNHILLLAETEVDAAHEHAERVELSDMLHKAVDMFGAVAETKGVQLVSEIAENVVVLGKRPHLRQVINNLLDNAIKFTAAGQVAVRLKIDSVAGQTQLEVADSGIGISESDLPHVFERFFRADNARSRESIHKGTGLGLSICRAVAEAHRGQIQVSSQLGVGTTFTVTLPLASDALTPGA